MANATHQSDAGDASTPAKPLQARSAVKFSMETIMKTTATAYGRFRLWRQAKLSSSLLGRLVAARTATGERRVGQQLLRMSDEGLRELGLSLRQIATLRATGRLTCTSAETRYGEFSTVCGSSN
jgi:RecB family exonuclease